MPPKSTRRLGARTRKQRTRPCPWSWSLDEWTWSGAYPEHRISGLRAPPPSATVYVACYRQTADETRSTSGDGRLVRGGTRQTPPAWQGARLSDLVSVDSSVPRSRHTYGSRRGRAQGADGRAPPAAPPHALRHALKRSATPPGAGLHHASNARPTNITADQ